MQKRKYEARSASKNVIEPIQLPYIDEEIQENDIMKDKYDADEESKQSTNPWNMIQSKN